MTDFILSKEFLFSYFQKFSDQDIDGLAEIFDDSIILKDWDISCNGKIASLQAIKGIYNAVSKISVEPLNILIDARTNSAACFLNIWVDSSPQPLKVVDFICVNNNGAITEISAYKQ